MAGWLDISGRRVGREGGRVRAKILYYGNDTLQHIPQSYIHTRNT